MKKIIFVGVLIFTTVAFWHMMETSKLILLPFIIVGAILTVVFYNLLKKDVQANKKEYKPLTKF